MVDTAYKYFDMKWKNYMYNMVNQTTWVPSVHSREDNVDNEYIKMHDKKIEWMFSYGDYNNDRTEIRDRFMKHMH
jgi:hypothetical protein